MIRHVFFPIRLATANDFKTTDGKAFLGKVYFIQNYDLTIDKKLHYLNEQTDKELFKALFNENRIFVFENPNEVIKVDECTLQEWNEVFPPAIQNQETIQFPA